MWSTSITHHSPWLCTIPHDSAISGPKSTCARHACNAEGMAHGVHKIEAPCTFNMVPDAIQWIFLVVALVPILLLNVDICYHFPRLSSTQCSHYPSLAMAKVGVHVSFRSVIQIQPLPLMVKI